MTPMFKTAAPALAACFLAVTPCITAAENAVLIRNATVHTVTDRGTLKATDVLLSDGRIQAVGTRLQAPAGAEIVDAAGRPLTPGLFGGLGRLGLLEIGLEPTAADYALKLGAMRPEFDVTPAFNPDSVEVGVSRASGITFAVLAPSAQSGNPGGTLIAGQGPLVTLDGAISTSSRMLFVDLGGDANDLSGGSRAAQFMLLRQAFMEARNPELVLANDHRLLTPVGRQALMEFIRGNGLFVFDVDRASDIRQVIRLTQREKLRAAIAGGAEAWRVAPELAAAQIPVILDPLDNLPASFDKVGATLENAARLHRAGAPFAFSLNDADPHNIRTLRQAAGNAVAHGLSWEAALAAITREPAAIFGVAEEMGTIEPGKAGNVVLWSGDPLEVTTLPDLVFIAGLPQSMRSRQTELRDRYLERVRAGGAR